MQRKNTTVTTAPYAITPKDRSYVSAGSQDISELIAKVNVLYIETVDSSDKKRPLCDEVKGEVIDIAVISPFLLIAILKQTKKKNNSKRERFVQFLSFQFDKST